MLKNGKQFNPNGHGLGLSISKNIAKCLGGDLTVDSVLDWGSTFDFTFESTFSLDRDQDYFDISIHEFWSENIETPVQKIEPISAKDQIIQEEIEPIAAKDQIIQELMIAS